MTNSTDGLSEQQRAAEALSLLTTVRATVRVACSTVQDVDHLLAGMIQAAEAKAAA